MRHQGDLGMPPDTEPLPDQVIANFEKWIAEGAPDPRSGKPVTTGVDLQEAREFWSLKPVQRPQVPSILNQVWPRADIDHFVLARLEAAQLEPVGDAAQRVLLRRLFFDLNGLPPTLENRIAFMKRQLSRRSIICWLRCTSVNDGEGTGSASLAMPKATVVLGIWQVNATTNGISTLLVSGKKLFVTTWQPLGDPENRGKIRTFAELRRHDADGNGRVARTELPRQYKFFQHPQSTVKEGGRSVSLRIIFGRIDSDEDGEISRNEFEQLFASKLGDPGLLSINLGGRGDITSTHVRVLEKRNIDEIPRRSYTRVASIWSKMVGS